MLVSVAVLPENVALKQLSEHDGRLVAGECVVPVGLGERFDHLPYDRLRELGDGAHEVATDGVCEVREHKRDDRLTPTGWLIFAVVCGFFGFLALWFFANWEADGDRIRMHWTIALIYAFGGKWGVSGTLWTIGGGMALMAFNTLTKSVASRESKQRKVESILQELAEDEDARVTLVGNANTPQERVVCLDHCRREYTIFLPLQWLDDAELKRAYRFFAPPEAVEPNAELGYTRPAAFSEILDENPTTAGERILAIFDEVYGLHPCFELARRNHTTFTDERDGDVEPAEIQMSTV